MPLSKRKKDLTSLDLIPGTLIDQAQLDESLQQQQTVMQQMLDVLNEKIENWVCQCFSDLRNRIIKLVSSSGMLRNSCYESIYASLLLSNVLLEWLLHHNHNSCKNMTCNGLTRDLTKAYLYRRKACNHMLLRFLVCGQGHCISAFSLTVATPHCFATRIRILNTSSQYFGTATVRKLVRQLSA